MILMRKKIEETLIALIDTWIPELNTIDNHLYDVMPEALPFVVVNVKEYEKGEGEIGADHPLKTYRVELYFIDMDADWNTGDTRRTALVGTLEEALDEDPYLSGCQVTGPRSREYVFNTGITSATFDSSGQEGEYSFATVIYLNVETAN